MNRCFVIGPIGDRLAPLGSDRREVYESALMVFEDVIKPACAGVGLDPVRADQIARSGEITEQIFRHLLEDEVVIADLSGANANVMYELGLRHTRNLLTITIGEYGLLPFDLSAIRTIQFSRSERGLIEARKQLQQALSVGLAEGGDPVTATRVWLSLAPDDVLSETEPSAPLLVEEDPDGDEGFLEQMATVETAFPAMTETIESISAILEELGQVGERLNTDVEALNSGGGSARERLQLIGRWAGLLQGPADRLTEATSKFSTEMHDVDPRMLGVLAYVANDRGSAGASDVVEFLETIIGMASSSRESMEVLNSLGGIVEGLGSVSKVLRRPGRQMAQTINTMANAVALIDVWESEARKALGVLELTQEEVDVEPISEDAGSKSE